MKPPGILASDRQCLKSTSDKGEYLDFSVKEWLKFAGVHVIDTTPPGCKPGMPQEECALRGTYTKEQIALGNAPEGAAPTARLSGITLRLNVRFYNSRLEWTYHGLGKRTKSFDNADADPVAVISVRLRSRRMSS